MKVSELIDILGKLNKDSDVEVCYKEDGIEGCGSNIVEVVALLSFTTTECSSPTVYIRHD